MRLPVYILLHGSLLLPFACGAPTEADVESLSGGESGAPATTGGDVGGAASLDVPESAGAPTGTTLGTTTMDGPKPKPQDEQDGSTACGYVGDIDDDDMLCFFDADNPDELVATIEHVLGISTMQDTLYVRLTLDPQFVDNTYGETAIGWEDTKKQGHTFKDLVGSDHGRLQLKDEDGGVLLDFQIDYISEDDAAPSGYKSLGVWGGDGKILAGPAEAVYAASTSLDRNLNERGASSYIVDSPATDLLYTPNPDAPDWDYRVVYEAWIATSLFPDGILHHACIDEIHASPSKAADNTKKVVPGPCWPDWECFLEDGCITTDDSGGDSTGDSTGGCPWNPDGSCDDGTIPPVP